MPEVTYRKLQELSLSLAGKMTRELGYGVGDKLALVLGGIKVESVIVLDGDVAVFPNEDTHTA